MPLFGGTKRPKLDGLLKEEERQRDSLNPEVLRRAGEKGVAGQSPAAVAVLREKTAAEPRNALWPLLLGWQQVSLGRYDLAVEAFLETIARDDDEVRAHYGAGSACFYAAEDARMTEGGWSADGPLSGKTVDNLYNESLRHFRRALELTEDRGERERLAKSIGGVEKALAKKAGRL
jgi:tetratricopeptide (TPR) repeat protein